MKLTTTTPNEARESYLQSGAKETFCGGQLVLYWEPYFPFDTERHELARQAKRAYTIDYGDNRYRFDTLEEADKFMQVLIAKIALNLN